MPKENTPNIEELGYNPVFATLRNPEDPRMLRHANLQPAVMAVPLPPEFSLFDKSLGITNQKFGSCVGASHTKEGEYQEKKESGKNVEFDYEWLYAMCKANDGIPSEEGTYPVIAAQIRQDYGLLPADVWKDKKTGTHKDFITIPAEQGEMFNALAFQHRSKGFVRAITLEEIKNILYTQNTPVTITVPVFEDYLSTDKDGNIKPNKGNQIGMHRVLVVGYSDIKGKIQIQNSWGSNYGKDGYMWYDYSRPMWDGMADVDYVDGPATSGAPVNIAWPVDKPYIIQHFGEDFLQMINGKMQYFYKYYGLLGHPGLDLRQTDGQGREGDPVYACDDGKVIYAKYRSEALGNTIIIQHSWGTSHYNHLQSGQVAIGQDVKRRDKIGKIGATGKVTGPHLHFAITINGVQSPGYGGMVDPLPYIKDQPTNTVPDAGIAKVKGSTLQVFYQKIGVPLQQSAAGVAGVNAQDMIAVAKDGKTQMYIHKLPSLEAKDFIKKAYKLGDTEPNIDEI